MIRTLQYDYNYYSKANDVPQGGRGWRHISPTMYYRVVEYEPRDIDFHYTWKCATCVLHI